MSTTRLNKLPWASLAVVVQLIAASLLLSITLWSQETPAESKWWPSEWGPEDQRGAANRIIPSKVIQAARLITDGKIYKLGHVYEPGMPLFGNRHYSLTIVSSPTGGPMGENQAVYHDEMFSGEIGQIGTQFDGLGHAGMRVGDEDIFYNGFKRSEFSKAYGLEKLGVENAGVFSPGVYWSILLDTKELRGFRLDM